MQASRGLVARSERALCTDAICIPIEGTFEFDRAKRASIASGNAERVFGWQPDRREQAHLAEFSTYGRLWSASRKPKPDLRYGTRLVVPCVSPPACFDRAPVWLLDADAQDDQHWQGDQPDRTHGWPQPVDLVEEAACHRSGQ